MGTEIIPGSVKNTGPNQFKLADGDITFEHVLTPGANTLGRSLFEQQLSNPNPDNALIFHDMVNGEDVTYGAFRYPTQIQLNGNQGGNITLSGYNRSVGDDNYTGHIWFIEPAAGVTVNTEFVNELQGGGIHYVIDSGTQTAAVHNHEGGKAKEVLEFRANTVNANFNGGYKAVDFVGATQNATVNYTGTNIADVINVTANNVTQNLTMKVSGNGSAFITTGNAKDVIDLSGFIGDNNIATADVLVTASLGGDMVKGANDTFEFLDFRNGLPSSVANIRVTAVNPEAFSNNNLRPDSDLKVEYLAANGSVIQAQGFTAEKFNGILYGNQNLSVAALVRDNGGTITFANSGQQSAASFMSQDTQAEVEAIAKSFKSSKVAGSNETDPVYTELPSIPKAEILPEAVQQNKR